MKNNRPSHPLDQLDALFPLTAAEQELVRTNPLALTPDDWTRLAYSIQQFLLNSYAAGGLTFDRMVGLQRTSSIGCPATTRILVLGTLVEQALMISPSEVRERVYPEPLQHFACAVVEHLRRVRTGEKLHTVLEEAAAWLGVLGMTDKGRAPSAGTLRNWYTRHRRNTGTSIARGRPRAQR